MNIFKHRGVVGPWTGAVLHGGILTWTDGSSTKFWSNQRIPRGHNDDSLIIVAKKYRQFKLSFANSHKKYPFFCEQDPRTPFVAYPNKGKEKVKKCDEDWLRSGTFCYKYFPRPLSFARAEMECTFHAGHLTSITSKEEYELVNKIIPNKHEIMNAWVGMKTWKGEKGAHWRWTDGAADSYKFKHAIDEVPRGADVARLLKYQGQPQGAFDTTKTHAYPFVCKKRVNALCEDQWQHFDGGCYRLFLNRRPFLDAEADCHRYNSHLTSMNSDAEYKFLRDMYRNKQRLGKRILNMFGNNIAIVGPWVGIVIHDANKVHFSWTDGSPTLYNPEVHKYKFIHKERNKLAVAKLAKAHHFLLWPEDMRNKMPYICEKKVGERRKNDIGSRAISKLRKLLQGIASGENVHKVPTKAPGYTKPKIGGPTPKHAITGTTTSKITSTATMKMTTPPVTSAEETTTTTTSSVVTTTQSTTTTTTTPTTNPTPVMTTTTSTTPTPTKHSNPAVTTTKRTTNVPETTSQPPKLKVPTTSTMPAPVTPLRPSNWTLFRDHLYGCIREKLSFDDAEKSCLKYGSHLVSIHSNKEYELVMRLMPRTERYPQAWIGMRVHHSATGEISFTWTDGTKDDYKALPMKLDGRPVGANAARVVITRARPLFGTVHDTKGASKYYFVCRSVEVTK
ncbi:secretory phospholipase A2 receptor-like [Lineus longissimus]|uniref:secretory phospholipase A2 receptor-like n=1 Tax=Lineus longissimus TaxID=88925 RepID=UPI00315CBF1A